MECEGAVAGRNLAPRKFGKLLLFSCVNFLLTESRIPRLLNPALIGPVSRERANAAPTCTIKLDHTQLIQIYPE